MTLMMDFDTFLDIKGNTLSWHTFNVESANKKPPGFHQSSCVFPDVILVSSYHSYKENTVRLLPYHSFYGGQTPPPQEKLSPLSCQSASKKYKAIRILIYQQSSKKFQTLSVMKFATFHIKQMWLLLFLCRI